MSFTIIIFTMVSIFFPLQGQIESKSLTVIQEPCQSMTKELNVEKVFQKNSDSTKTKRKIILNNKIDKKMLGYQYCGTWHPTKFKLQIGDDIFTEFKNDKESEVKNLVQQKEILIDEDYIEISHEYEWPVPSYNGKKKQKFVIEANVESIDLEFDWNVRKAEYEHIVLKKNYAQSKIIPSKNEKS